MKLVLVTELLMSSNKAQAHYFVIITEQ